MRIAIAGCGQLARMLALAGWEMGHQFSFIADPGEGTDCVAGLGPVCTWDTNTSIAQLYDELGKPDVYTDGAAVKRLTAEREDVESSLLPLEQEWERRAL